VTLSVDVLAAVCNQLEPTPTTTGSVAALRHEKNQTILALSNVCRLWCHHITGCKHLFRDIAFDASCRESVVTAGVFLKMLEGTRVPISVYANLGQSPHPSSAVTKLFIQLRPHIQRIVHFEYDGDMAGYRSHLDRPAPSLRFFSDGFDTHPGNGLPIFRGQMPELRVLIALSPTSQIVWATSTLPNLTILNLGFLDMGPSIPLSSLLDLLRGSPRLENISVQCFTPVVNPNEAIQKVLLPLLHTLTLRHNEFHTILKHLGMPNVRKVFFCGESYPVSGQELNPTFKDLHLFAGVPPFPIFERPIETLRLETTGNGRTNVDFRIRLAAEEGFVVQVSLSWILDAVPLFDEYLKHSIMWLTGVVSLAPQARVELFLAYMAPLDIPVYQPFLLAVDIGNLTIWGGFGVDVLDRLTARAGSECPLPRLKLLNIVGQLPISGEEGRRALTSCLRSRVAGRVRLSIRLLGTEVPGMDLIGSGCVVEREL